MGWKSNSLTGLWARRIRRLDAYNSESGSYEIQVSQEDLAKMKDAGIGFSVLLEPGETRMLEVKVDAGTVDRMKDLRVGDMLQVWTNDRRNSDNSPTHNLRSRRQDGQES